MNVTRLQPAEIPQIWHCLQQISDPELPVLSITDLGMVRDVARDGAGWRVTFTPTYSGCPATEHLLGAIRETLLRSAARPRPGSLPALRQHPQREDQRVRLHRL